MATTIAQRQGIQLRRSQAQRPHVRAEAEQEESSLSVPTNRGAALRMAQTLATGQRNAAASLDKQAAGEVAARLGQVYAGPIGKRLGRLLGENWRVVVVLLILQIAIPFLVVSVGLYIIFTTLLSFGS